MSSFSTATVFGSTTRMRWPRTAAACASPIPVLPEEASTIVPPGSRDPSRSAASTIAVAARSLTEPPGFRYSTLTSTVAERPSVSLRSRTSGVSPTRSINES